MKNKINKFLLVLFLVLSPVMVSLADPPGPPPDPLGGPGAPTPIGAPIDNGTIILILLGVIYVVYKNFQGRKQLKTILHKIIHK